MKIKSGFILREISNTFIVVPVGERVVDFRGMITLNESGSYLWNELQSDKTRDQLILAMTTKYDIDEETATSDVIEFLGNLEKESIIE